MFPVNWWAILMAVVTASVSNEDVSVSVEVAYEFDVDDDSDSTEEVDATNSSVVVPSVDMNNGEDDDWVELTAVTGVIDSVVDSVISLFVVAFEDEMIFDVDFSVVTVEVSPLLVSVEEYVNNVVSDAVVDSIDGYIEVLTVVIGWTDDVSKIDVDDDSDSTEEVDAINSSVVVPSVDMNNGEDDDWVELKAVTGVIDSVVDSVISLFVVAFEDEMIFDVDFSVVTVEVSPLLVSVEEYVNNVVSDAVVESIDGYIEVLTVVIGWTDDVSKIDVVISVLCSVIDDDDDAKDDVSSELVAILMAVVAASVSNGDVSVSVSVEVTYECDVDDDSDSTEEVDATNSSVVVPSVDMNNGEDDDWVELTADTGVIDSVVDSVISLFVVAFEDEIIFDVDFSVVTVEVSPLLVSVEECENDVVSGAIELDAVLIVEINWLVGSSDSTDEVRSFWVLNSVEYEDSSNMDVTTVEVTVYNVSVVVSLVEMFSFVVFSVLMDWLVDCTSLVLGWMDEGVVDSKVIELLSREACVE